MDATLLVQVAERGCKVGGDLAHREEVVAHDVFVADRFKAAAVAAFERE